MKRTKIDKLFAFVERRWKWFLALGIALGGLMWWYAAGLKALLDPHKGFFELLAMLFGPPVTLLGFYLGYRSKREMVGIHEQIDCYRDTASASRRLSFMASQQRVPTLEISR